ncbi:FAD/NAD(P)-dependent oxidoreductase [Acuticoccus sediminis]|uniref:FAD/NAD(P)-dependent oxidoreductase n=1 Tax=Acuticoccus sediminis TaxID=2184697 RepID=UPI001CFDF2E1|nr:FAD/NAD(P)-binding oxidoreductase [Acuticoccus sediminis]
MARPRIVIVGAGPAGVRAAEVLAEAALEPLVIDEAPAAGGQIYRQPPASHRRPPERLYGLEAGRAVRVHRAFEAVSGQVEHWPNSSVWGVDGRNLMVTRSNGRIVAVPYAKVILATGATDRTIPVEGWTMPGVFTLGGAQIALKYQACLIGEHAVFVGTGPLLYLVAFQTLKAGGRVAGVFDTTPFGHKARNMWRMAALPAALLKGLSYYARLIAHGVPVHSGVTPVRIEGAGRVEALVVKDRAGHEIRTACDGVGLGYHVQSETQLADLFRIPFTFDPPSRQWLPEVDAAGRAAADVYLAGDGARVRGADVAEATGARAALACLEDLGHQVDPAAVARIDRVIARGSRFAAGVRATFPVPDHLLAGVPDDTVLCRCEEVTFGTYRAALAGRGASEVNRAKAFCRVGMGRCQGRMCGLSAAGVAAAALAVPLPDVGRLRGQAPVKPLVVTEAAE